MRPPTRSAAPSSASLRFRRPLALVVATALGLGLGAVTLPAPALAEQGCPPGLAKKGCVPPGQAKKYRGGIRLRENDDDDDGRRGYDYGPRPGYGGYWPSPYPPYPYYPPNPRPRVIIVERGDYIGDRDYMWLEDPRRYGLPQRPGDRYALIGDQVLRIDRDTMTVLEVMGLLSRILN